MATFVADIGDVPRKRVSVLVPHHLLITSKIVPTIDVDDTDGSVGRILQQTIIENKFEVRAATDPNFRKGLALDWRSGTGLVPEKHSASVFLAQIVNVNEN